MTQCGHFSYVEVEMDCILNGLILGGFLVVSAPPLFLLIHLLLFHTELKQIAIMICVYFHQLVLPLQGGMFQVGTERLLLITKAPFGLV